MTCLHLLESPAPPPSPQDAFYRPQLPNIMNLLATIAVFCMVVYFQASAFPPFSLAFPPLPPSLLVRSSGQAARAQGAA